MQNTSITILQYSKIDSLFPKQIRKLQKRCINVVPEQN